ncbi:hypothetical protein ACFPT7_16455 [Acidicapsa dinghuensis]|uniref:DUF4352 domain-containing protein n=1 Tax=Acidicapsa dinghuensis TaxID=2218256 RepID=A0ABW1EHW2_9BACT|nr:hypothetical protein [Acidicapsa dinghuensis]
MSLLQIQNDPVHEHDASSEGEDLAKGSSHIIWAAIAAAVVITAAVWIFWVFIHKPPVAAGAVTQMWAHGVHTLSTPIDANGVQYTPENFDQVLVLANLSIRNQSDKPIVLRDVMTNATFEDGPHSSYIAGAVDYQRIFVAYPELKNLQASPIIRETVISPGQTLSGMVVSSFRVTKEQWESRKDLSFTVQFQYHPDLTLTPAGPIQTI